MIGLPLWLSNLGSWWLQIGVLVAAGSLLPLVFRLRAPRERLIYWQVLLVMCLLLPLVQPWRQSVASWQVTATTRVVAQGPAGPSGRRHIPVALVLAGAMGGGFLLRLGWLGMGLLRLRRYRRTAEPIDPLPPSFETLQRRLYVYPEIALSPDVSSPITFGFRRPVVLFPPHFLRLEPHLQESIACHELLHVGRKDWLFTLAEEFIRSLCWFHPAIWWLVGEIHLAREQAVDRAVVELTGSREQYLDALLAIAAARVELDLAPAPLFLRRRHLSQRVAALLKEVSMSKKRLISSLASIFGLLLAAGWFAASSFPLRAQPQDDAAGVTVNTQGASLLHRAPVDYPAEARSKRVQGTVIVEADLSETGAVTDARVLSGPPELRRAALASVLDWHFSRETVAGPRLQIAIQFQLPPGEPGAIAIPAADSDRNLGVLKQINVAPDVPAPARGVLPLKVGDTLTPAKLEQALAELVRIDEHLDLQIRAVEGGQAVRIRMAERNAGVPGGGGAPQRIRVGGNVQQTKLLEKKVPKYPPEAKAAGIQGTVKLMAVIGKDGRVKTLEVLSGDPLLASAALEAVKEWVYSTTHLNGEPVEVATQIDIHFTLNQ